MDSDVGRRFDHRARGVDHDPGTGIDRRDFDPKRSLLDLPVHAVIRIDADAVLRIVGARGLGRERSGIAGG